MQEGRQPSRQTTDSQHHNGHQPPKPTPTLTPTRAPTTTPNTAAQVLGNSQIRGCVEPTCATVACAEGLEYWRGSSDQALPAAFKWKRKVSNMRGRLKHGVVALGARSTPSYLLDTAPKNGRKRRQCRESWVMYLYITRVLHDIVQRMLERSRCVRLGLGMVTLREEEICYPLDIRDQQEPKLKDRGTSECQS